MEKVKNGKNLKEKVLFLMCLGVLAGNMSAGVYAQQNPENNIKDFSSLIGKEFKEVFNKTPENDKDKIKLNIFEKEAINIDKNGQLKLIMNNNQIWTEVGANVNFSFDNTVKINNSFNNSAVFIDNDKSKSLNVNFNNDVNIVTNKSILNILSPNLKSYALYSNSSQNTSGAGATASIILGAKGNNSKIKVIGDLGVQNEKEFYKDTMQEGYKNNNSSTIELNLNNEDSFFAGKMLSEKVKQNKESDSKIWLEGIEKITLNLKNGATWYAHDSNGKDSYNISGGTADSVDGNLQTFITSNGGVIDIYHHSPNKTYADITSEQMEQLKVFIDFLKQQEPNLSQDKINLITGKLESIILEENKRELGGRTFTLNGVGDRLQNTTFRISTDVENKKSDKKRIRWKNIYFKWSRR